MAGGAEIRVHSGRFGDFVVPEKQLLSFPDGLVGFPSCSRFVILEHRTPSVLRWLLCVDEPNLAFAVVDPADFFDDYSVSGCEALDVLGLETEDDLALLAIVTIPEDPVSMSANLMAPVAVNARTRVAHQIVLDDDRYSPRHLLLARERLSHDRQD